MYIIYSVWVREDSDQCSYLGGESFCDQSLLPKLVYIIYDHIWLSPANFMATYNGQTFHDMPGKKLEIFGKEHNDNLKPSLCF